MRGAHLGPVPSFGTLSVATASDEDRESWDAFVCRSLGASFCHLFGWKTVFERAYRKRCDYLIARASERIVGVLPLVRMSIPFVGRRLVSLPFLDRGGVLAESGDAGEVLIRPATDLGRRLNVGGVDLRGSVPALAPELPTQRYALMLPLPGSSELLWKAIGGKVRNQIRKAEKSGLATSAATVQDLPEFYKVFARNMRDLGSPVHSYPLFREILLEFGSAATLFLTRDGNRSVVAAGIALRFDDTVTVPWASSLRSARPACPNHSLYWAVLEFSIAKGVSLFDFGRSALGSGTFEFKRHWGAEPEPLLWSSIGPDGEVREEPLLDSGKHPILSGVWSRLPLPLATLLGPVVRRHLAN